MPQLILNDRKGWVVQEYISNPLLLDELKFDLRIYVLLCSVDPLRAYVCSEGLVRLCSEKYVKPKASNLRDAYSHLTNYSLNKLNEAYVHTPAEADVMMEEEEDEEEDEEDGKGDEADDVASVSVSTGAGASGGSKRYLSDLLEGLEAQGLMETTEFFDKLKDLVAKTLIAYQPNLALAYRQNFPKKRSGDGGGAEGNGDTDEAEADGDDSFRCFQVRE